MKRLFAGLAVLAIGLVAVVLVVPLLLPKDAIKDTVVDRFETATGWQLRLDGPVSLSLIPSFVLIAEDVGISGEAGADGIEFASVEVLDFGLSWGALFGGELRITGLELVRPQIFMEIDRRGGTTWEPRRALAAAQDGSAPGSGETAPASGSGFGAWLERVAIDRLLISEGQLVYSDRRSEVRHEVSSLEADLRVPDLGGTTNLSAAFIWQDVPLQITGDIDSLLALTRQEAADVSLKIASSDNTVDIAGAIAVDPPRADLSVSAGGPSVAALAGLLGQELPKDPGAYSLSAKVEASEAAISIADLKANIGDTELDGYVEADLASDQGPLSGRLVMRNGPLADFLTYAGQDLPATGLVGADLAFSATGRDMPAILASLGINGTVSLTDGEISGLDLASHVGGDTAADSLRDVGLTVRLEGLDKPVNLSGTATWRDEGFTITGNATPAPMLAGLTAPVTARVKGNRFSVGFNGNAALSGALEGGVSVETGDLRGLLAWIGQPLGDGNGLGPFSASGIFSADTGAYAFEETTFRLDDIRGTGEGRLTLAGKPSLTAVLALQTLALDPYLSSKTAGKAGSPGNTSGGNGGSGWSTAPIDFGGLKAIDADLTLTTDAITYDQLQIGKSALGIKISGGVLDAELSELSLYDGAGRGALRLDGAASRPAVAAEFSLQGMQAYPFLKDAANFEWLEGLTNVQLDVTSAGGSEAELVSGLNGSARFEFADGAIRGLNIPRMMRGLTLETLLGWNENPAEKTDFSSLAGTFEIANGVARNDDLSLVGPLVRMRGGGTTDLPQQSLDWKLEPEIVASLEGQAPTPRAKGTDKEMAGLGVPVIVSGTWAEPKIYPDIAGILENPQAAFEKLKSMSGGLANVLNGTPPEEVLVEEANKIIERATGGNTQIDVKKVIEGDVDNNEVLKAVEEGFGLPSGFLGSLGGKKKN